MHSTNGSRIMDGLLRVLGDRGARRHRVWQEERMGMYYLFEEGEPGELRFNSSFPAARKILDLDYYQAKVFIQRIKSIQIEMGFYGDDKEDNSDRKRSGSDDPGSCTGESESGQGRPSGDDQLPGANVDGGGSDGGETEGNRANENTARLGEE